MPFTYHELEPDRWSDLTKLLGKNGAQDGCWCMWWRRPTAGKLWEAKKGRPNRDAMRRLVKNRKASGVLAYDRSGDVETPVGWAAFGSRADFPRVDRTKAFKRPEEDREVTDSVWCINCFFIARGYRRQGIARGLLAAAVQAMRQRGVDCIEAYPVTTTGAGKRVEPAFAYTGPIAIFEELGFQEIQRLAPTRPLLRLNLVSHHTT
ncbi:MAG TPA: GNAT family N-acetyltransferase [Dehalococcoidia bacterium]|nr:GNAT family N-acetyltransferase [Dehalococcoidia bacterium]